MAVAQSNKISHKVGYSRDFATGLTEKTSQWWQAVSNNSTVLHLISPEIQPLISPLH